MSKMLEEVAAMKDSARHTAETGEGGNPDGQNEELPEGSSPLEAREETSESEDSAPEETSGEGESETPVIEAKGKGGKIRIGEREFDDNESAFAYAEQISREKELTDAHASGIREALEATRAPAPPQEEPEDDFDARFYANPKEALKSVKGEAVQEALRIIKAEQTRENLWQQFLEANPDIRRKDAERILQENSDTIGRMTDTGAAMKKLAQKTRDEYREIIEAAKPRTELKSSKQAQSPSGGGSKSVTPKKDIAKPLSFIEEVRQNRRSSEN